MPINDFLNSKIKPLGFKKAWKKEKVDSKNNIWRLFFSPIESNDVFLEVRACLGNKNKYILIKNYKNLDFNKTHWGLELPIDWIYSFLKENSDSAFKINNVVLDAQNAEKASARFHQRGVTATAYTFNSSLKKQVEKAKEEIKAEKNRNKIIEEDRVREIEALRSEKALIEKQNKQLIEKQIRIKKIPGYRKGAEICSRCGGDGGVRGGCGECDGTGWYSYENS